ncbi:uncharacterized protein LOC129616334 [Condylostylus longicornis]|uniref:uncharacterized protein LOC129616334 n=1 Tax=Condylostylus longicornis TaxID=2530218 RepID=UPI00244DD991|nr:uncharacterized protein LOC129616334 [Condylostylus longicornis]
MVISSSSEGDNDQIDLTVNYGEISIFQDRNRRVMKTAFTSTHSGDYQICVMNFGAVGATVTIAIDQGPEAKDYSQIAKKEQLDPLIVSLRRVEDQLREYHRNLLHMRSKELKMRKINDSTSNQVVFFCLLGVAVMFVATLLQILYFRNFLRSKKVI